MVSTSESSALPIVVVLVLVVVVDLYSEMDIVLDPARFRYESLQ